MRHTVLVFAIAAVAALIALSIVGAFGGADRAAAMFNSPLMAVVWVLLATALVVGSLVCRSVRRRPGLLAVHFGCALVIIGGMLGSSRGHELVDRWFGDGRIRRGVTALNVGQAGDRVILPDGKPAGPLPFRLRADEAWIEYYQPAELLILPTDDNQDVTAVEWPSDEPVPIGGTDLTVRVLQYLPRARGRYALDARGRLAVIGPDGKAVFTPDRVGRAAVLTDPKLSVHIVKVLDNPTLVADGDGWRVVDQPGVRSNPALEVEVRWDDGKIMPTLLFARPAPRPVLPSGVILRYIFADPPIAAADETSRYPAMQIELAGPADTRRLWLIGDPAWDRDRIPPATLDELNGGGAAVLLTRARRTVKDYKAALTVLADGKSVARKIVEANAPLHYGGYHFYLARLDPDDLTYLVLDVRSDRGLTTVYVGFGLLCGGLIWQFWLGRIRVQQHNRDRHDGRTPVDDDLDNAADDGRIDPPGG